MAYIGGPPRSGSTLLALMLGQLPGFVAVGELSYLWERGLLNNHLCGCGVPFRDCPFWTQVGVEAFEGWDSVDASEILRLKRDVARFRHWPNLLAQGLRPSFTTDVAAYSGYLERLYGGIKSASRCSVVVDSSKSPTPAFLLPAMPSVNARVVHLVRDSRAAAFSWTRRVVRPEVATELTYMETYGPFEASVSWSVTNLGFHCLDFARIPRLLIKYESLVSSPRLEIERIAKFLGLASADLDLSFLDRGLVRLPRNHTVSGNPLRFRQGEVPLRLDDEWAVKMKRRDRMLVSLLTLPFLVAYGYPVREHG